MTIPGLLFTLASLAATAEGPSETLLAWLDQQAAGGDTAAATRAATVRREMSGNANWLDHVQGKHEWAYRSQCDDSLQPFTIVLPDRRNAPPPWPLVVVLHGGGGSHKTSRQDFPPGVCFLQVLGQGPSARWRGLSENDVREAITAVCSWWPVDRSRMTVTGFSLGGAGSFVLASRHPDWFAAAAPIAGWGGSNWPGNLVATPLLAVTSRDDFAIHRFCRAQMQAVAAQGGKAHHLITDHIGHGYPTAFSQAIDRWVTTAKPLPPPEKFRYVAEDAAAASAWGITVTAWGNAPLPASFAWSRKTGTLELTTENVAAMDLTPAAWGHKPEAPLQISIDGVEVAAYAGPVPNRISLVKSETWKQGELSTRPHAPGGLDAVLHGQRVYIVYGTAGDQATVPARRALADRLARMPSASIHLDTQRVHGSLPVLSDAQALAQLPVGDIILLGTPAENRLAEFWQSQLPARLEPGVLKIDQAHFPLVGACASILGRIGERQVVWIVDGDGPVSDWSRLPFHLLGSDTRSTVCPDLLIAADQGQRLVAARRLGGDWTWHAPAPSQRPLAVGECSAEQLAQIRAACLRAAAGSVGGLAIVREPEVGFRIYPTTTAGTTTLEDVACLHGWDRILILELAQSQLEQLLAVKDLQLAYSGPIPLSGRQRIACIHEDAWAILRVIKDPELPLAATELLVATALREYGRQVLDAHNSGEIPGENAKH